MVKTINEQFSDEEFKKLSSRKFHAGIEKKMTLSWHDFILLVAKVK